MRAAMAGALLLSALAAGPSARAADSYVESVTAGLERLQEGKPDAAATAFRAAIARDANDPAAWLAYGALLLNVRQITPAKRAFYRAATLAPDSPRTAMALALCDLAEGKAADADALLAKAEKRGAPLASVHRAYIAAMGGERGKAQSFLDDAAPEAGGAPLARAVRAWLGGKSADEIAAWEGIVPAGGEGGHAPLLASFTPWKPFNHAWQANAGIPPPPAPPPGEPLSGGMPLSAQAASDTKYVVFTIDGVDMGITNVQPFTWNWDTTGAPNGIHVVRLTAVRADGSSKSQEMRVQTRNANAPARPEHPGIADVNARLDAALSLQPDLRYARYVLGQAALDAGDTATARRRFQGVVADDPKYQNAAHLLRTLPRATDGVEIWRGPAGRKRIALTFDDGPNPRRTPELLDLLKSLDVRGTFFFVGKQAALHPDIVRRAAAEGHEVGNHTWDHRNLRKISGPEALRELAATNRLLTHLTGQPPRFFRPPGGNISAEAREAGAALNVAPAMWTFLGGKTEGMPVETMAPEFIQAAKPGAIFLIHDGTKKIGEMLPLVVQALRAEGYTFVTLSELMGDPPPAVRTALRAEPAEQ